MRSALLTLEATESGMLCDSGHTGHMEQGREQGSKGPGERVWSHPGLRQGGRVKRARQRTVPSNNEVSYLGGMPGSGDTGRQNPQ